MKTLEVTYNGKLRTTATHCKTGTSIFTDAPTDNHGLGEGFAPSDLVASALASCIITIMGIKSRDLNLPDLDINADIDKVMAVNPRRISEINIKLYLPKSLSDDNRKILEMVADTCPVGKSLHADLKQNITFYYR